MAAGVGLAPTPAGLQPAVQTFYTIQRDDSFVHRNRTGVAVIAV